MVYLFFLLLLGNTLSAQSPYYRFTVEEENLRLVDAKTGLQLAKGREIIAINGHPGLQGLTEGRALPLPAGSDWSIFVVYLPTGKAEECVWSVVAGDTTRQLLTTHRLADLQRGAFRDLTLAAQPSLRTYFRQREKSGAENAFDAEAAPPYLRIGSHSGRPQLPAVDFTGAIAEVIVFDRQLSPLRRQLIESRLALTYGITLSQDTPRHYLVAEGKVVWDALENRDFPYRIAGVGAAKDGSWQQTLGRSSAAEGEILGVETKGPIPADTYLCWSDNGAPTDLRPMDNDRQWLSRRWSMQRTGDAKLDTMVLTLDPQALFAVVPRSAPWRLYLTERAGSETDQWVEFEPRSLDEKGRIRWELPAAILPPTNDFQFTFGIATPPPDELLVAGTWRIAPNPARVNEPLLLRGITPEVGRVRLEVHNVLGRRLFTKTGALTTHHVFDFTPGQPGTYLLSFFRGKEKTTHRVVVHR